MASTSASLSPPGFHHHQLSLSPTYSSDEDFGANTDDDETCRSTPQDPHSQQSIRKDGKGKTSSFRDEIGEEDKDADCTELKETLAELKSVITGLLKVEQNEKILKELQSTSSSRYLVISY